MSAPKVQSVNSLMVRDGPTQIGMPRDGRTAATYDYRVGAVLDHVKRTHPPVQYDDLSFGNTKFERSISAQWIEIKRPRKFWGDLRPKQPGQTLVPLIAKASSIVKQGHATVGTQDTTHYRVTESLKAWFALEQAVGPGPPLPKGAHTGTPFSIAGTVTTDLYLDSRGRPIRAQLSVIEHPPTAKNGTTVGGIGTTTSTTTWAFSNYNSAATVRRPPPSQVAQVVTAKNITEYEKATNLAFNS